MLVYEYINLLVASEIKPLEVSNIGGDNRDEFQDNNLNELISLINLANSAIHAKFALIQKEFILEDIENNKPFTLPNDYVYPVAAELRDGTPVSINDEKRGLVGDVDKKLSLMFPEPFVCLVKGEDFNGQTDISLVYVADTVKVSKPNDRIYLTSVFTQALIHYVAYKAFTGVNGHIDTTNNTFYMRFVADCKEIKEKGLVASDNLNSNEKLDDRGFP